MRGYCIGDDRGHCGDDTARAAPPKTIELLKMLKDSRGRPPGSSSTAGPHVHCVYKMLVAGVTCLKHEGFKEEREWRLIYAPNRWPSPLIEPSTHMIKGIPLDSYGEDTYVSLEITTAGHIICQPKPEKSTEQYP
jgi:hypothetical protein